VTTIDPQPEATPTTSTAPVDRPVVLSMRGISKRYGPVKANDNISVDFRAGEIHALLGENGSGKSTILGIASGIVVPDAGEIDIVGQRLTSASPTQAMRLGLGMAYQTMTEVAGLTVARTLGPGRERGRPVLVWDVHEDTAAALSLKSWLPAALRPVVSGAVRVAERWAERHLRLLLAESSYAARFRRPHPVVPNTVPVPAAEPSPPGPDRLVYVGRITRQRGGLDMVALGRLLDGEVRVELIGPVDRDIAEQVADAVRRGWVHRHGFVPNDAALQLLDGALAGLSLLHDEPNYASSRPTKVMEYMAHGVPVVTTPNASSVELVERYGCGLVVPFDDPRATAAAPSGRRAGCPRDRCAG